MPFTSGSFSLYSPGNPVVTGTTISSTWANNTLNDIATGLSTCLLKDGSQTVTANIPMSSFKFTGLAAGSSSGDSVRYEQACKLDVASQTVTGGVVVTSDSLGTISGGTVTPNPGDRPLQHYTNGGAHTLAPSGNSGTVVVDVTNNASAGAITTSGFTLVTGAFDTTNAHKFRCFISIGNGGSLLQIQPLQ